MEEKLKIIDKICSFHPHYGVEKRWSDYTGGMKDSGEWHVRRMLDASIEGLKSFLDKITTKENQPPRVLTEEEKIKSKIIIPFNGGFITQLGKEDIEKWHYEMQRKLFGL